MMIGYEWVGVIVDGCVKGIGDFDGKKGLEGWVGRGNMDDYGGMGVYKKDGYVG